MECSLDEEHVVVIDGRKFHTDQSLTRVGLRRLRDINQFDDVGWIESLFENQQSHPLTARPLVGLSQLRRHISFGMTRLR